jgi:hypothetical protein
MPASLGRAVTPAPPGKVATPIVNTALHSDVSPPLRSIEAAPTAPAQDVTEVPLKGRTHVATQVPPVRPAPPAATAPPDQSAPEGALSPSPIITFDGLTQNGYLPPDQNGAVGPNHYVQIVNVRLGVYNKATGAQVLNIPINSLWAGFGGLCQSHNDGDPIVLYDRYANRWLVSQLAIGSLISGPFLQCVAVSATADPTGQYNRYSFLISENKLNDYPKFGVWPDGYYMTYNQYKDCHVVAGSLHCVWAGGGVSIFERDKMVLGRPGNQVHQVRFDLEDADVHWGNLLPADLDGPVLPPQGSPSYIVGLANDILDNDEDTAPLPVLQVFNAHVDWKLPNNSTFTLGQNLDTAAFNPWFNPDLCTDDDPVLQFPTNCIPQPSVGQQLEALSDRLMYRLQYRNFGDHEALVTNHTVNVAPDGDNRAGIRWYELRQQSGQPWGIYQQGTFAPNDAHSRWMGSIAMDEMENIALGYSISSSTMFPSVRYDTRTPSDPAGTLPQGEVVLFAGSGSQTHPSGRWGDYSSMSLDFNDDCTFWYTNQYLAETSSALWRTRIGAFKFPGCGNRGTG